MKFLPILYFFLTTSLTLKCIGTNHQSFNGTPSALMNVEKIRCRKFEQEASQLRAAAPHSHRKKQLMISVAPTPSPVFLIAIKRSNANDASFHSSRLSPLLTSKPRLDCINGHLFHFRLSSGGVIGRGRSSQIPPL